MEIVILNRPIELHREGEVFQLPLPHLFVRWNGHNPVYGHFLELVDEKGQRAICDDIMSSAFESRLIRIGNSRFQLHHQLTSVTLNINFSDHSGRIFLIVSAAETT